VSIKNPESRVTHEAVAGKLEEEQLFYLLSRGLSEREAESLLIHGFVEPIVEKLPLEYALELDRLIDLKLKNDKENKISVSNL
jgi:Fe-S cluster assembly protein SufB